MDQNQLGIHKEVQLIFWLNIDQPMLMDQDLDQSFAVAL